MSIFIYTHQEHAILKKKHGFQKKFAEWKKKFVDLDIFACLKNTNLKSWFLGFEKICGFQKKSMDLEKAHEFE